MTHKEEGAGLPWITTEIGCRKLSSSPFRNIKSERDLPMLKEKAH